MSEEVNLEPSDLAKRRIVYAANVSALQLETARAMVEEMTKVPPSPSDPLVLALFQAIAVNYSAIVTRPSK